MTTPLKILQINATIAPRGADRAMHRLHLGLRHRGHHSQIIAQNRLINEEDIFTFHEFAGQSPLFAEKVFRRVSVYLDNNWGVQALHREPQHMLQNPTLASVDVINLHNLHGRYFNFARLPQLARQFPIVWTLHDMWAFTGHCTYSFGCERWKAGCYDCPLMKGMARKLIYPRPTHLDRSRTIWQKKHSVFTKSNLHIITPSQWLCDLVQESTLSEHTQSIQTVSNGLDLTVFRPLERARIRAAFNVPPGKKVLLFVSANLRNPRKGLLYLIQALQTFSNPEDYFLLTIGSEERVPKAIEHFQHKNMGVIIAEAELCKIYNAADLFVFPTLADNQPLVVMEALACGTPVVTFAVGGLPEMIDHLETGYLAREKDAKDFAFGIQTLLDQLSPQLKTHCRQAAEKKYALGLQVEQYEKVYQRAIETFNLQK